MSFSFRADFSEKCGRSAVLSRPAGGKWVRAGVVQLLNVTHCDVRNLLYIWFRGVSRETWVWNFKLFFFFFFCWSGVRGNRGVSLRAPTQYYCTESNLAYIVHSGIAELGGAPRHNALTVNMQLPVCHKSQASAQTRHCQKLHILSKCDFSTMGALRTGTLVFLGTSWNRCERMRMQNLDCRCSARSRPSHIIARLCYEISLVISRFSRTCFLAWSTDKAACC